LALCKLNFCSKRETRFYVIFNFDFLQKAVPSFAETNNFKNTVYTIYEAGMSWWIYRPDVRELMVQFWPGARNLALFQNVQTSVGAHNNLLLNG
jgi:hypothetical protein